MPAQMAGNIECNQAHEDFQHVAHWKVNAEDQRDDSNRRDLTNDGDPAQLYQLLHILVAGRIFATHNGASIFQVFFNRRNFSFSQHLQFLGLYNRRGWQRTKAINVLALVLPCALRASPKRPRLPPSRQEHTK